MADSLSVAYEHRESFRIFYSAAKRYLKKNDRIYSAKFKRFRILIEQPLLQLPQILHQILHILVLLLDLKVMHY